MDRLSKLRFAASNNAETSQLQQYTQNLQQQIRQAQEETARNPIRKEENPDYKVAEKIALNYPHLIRFLPKGLREQAERMATSENITIKEVPYNPKAVDILLPELKSQIPFGQYQTVTEKTYTPAPLRPSYIPQQQLPQQMQSSVEPLKFGTRVLDTAKVSLERLNPNRLRGLLPPDKPQQLSEYRAVGPNLRQTVQYVKRAPEEMPAAQRYEAETQRKFVESSLKIDQKQYELESQVEQGLITPEYAQSQLDSYVELQNIDIGKYTQNAQKDYQLLEAKQQFPKRFAESAAWGGLTVLAPPLAGALFAVGIARSAVSGEGKRQIQQVVSGIRNKQMSWGGLAVNTGANLGGFASGSIGSRLVTNVLKQPALQTAVPTVTQVSGLSRYKTIQEVERNLVNDVKAMREVEKLTATRAYEVKVENGNKLKFVEYSRGDGTSGMRRLIGLEVDNKGRVVSGIGGITIESGEEAVNSISRVLRIPVKGKYAEMSTYLEKANIVGYARGKKKFPPESMWLSSAENRLKSTEKVKIKDLNKNKFPQFFSQEQIKAYRKEPFTFNEYKNAQPLAESMTATKMIGKQARFTQLSGENNFLLSARRITNRRYKEVGYSEDTPLNIVNKIKPKRNSLEMYNSDTKAWDMFMGAGKKVGQQIKQNIKSASKKVFPQQSSANLIKGIVKTIPEEKSFGIPKSVWAGTGLYELTSGGSIGKGFGLFSRTNPDTTLKSPSSFKLQGRQLDLLNSNVGTKNKEEDDLRNKNRNRIIDRFVNKVKDSEYFKEFLSLRNNQVQIQNQFNRQVQRQKLTQLTKTPLRLKIRTTPKPPKIKIPSAPRVVYKTSNGKIAKDGESYIVFAKRYGVDRVVGIYSSLDDAKNSLKNYLTGGLGASGFITPKTNTKQRLNIDLGFGFRRSKREPQRVVQEDWFRLGSSGERREIQSARKQQRVDWFGGKRRKAKTLKWF